MNRTVDNVLYVTDLDQGCEGIFCYPSWDGAVWTWKHHRFGCPLLRGDS